MNRNLLLSVFAASAAILTSSAETPDKWVRYVEATGSQYVDTGVTGRWNTKIEAKVEWMDVASEASFLGARSGAWGEANADGRMYFCYCLNENGEMATASDTYKNVYLMSGSSQWNWRWELNRVYTYTSEFTVTNAAGKTTSKITADGNTASTIEFTGIDTGYNLYLFANNQKGNAVYKAKARCYGLKIWQGPKDGGDMVLVRDFQPCMKGGKAGLYDAVSEKIFYSISGTDLICDENSEVPDEFIEYVESSGNAAEKDSQIPSYIDTGVIGRSGTKVEGEFAILKHEDAGLLGSRNNKLSNPRFYLLQSYNSKITCGYGTHKDNSNTLELGKKYWVSTELNAGSQLEKIGADGTTSTVYSASDAASINTGYTMYLFSCNVEGTPTWFSKARCYGFKVWQDGALVRDFRPCLKNGVAGLYDDVSKRIFYSLGTPLSYDTRKKAKAKEIVFVEYIESDGNNTLDTGVPARSGTRAKGEMTWVTPGDFGNGYLRTWNHENYRYLENTAAPGVWYRQKRSYLGAVDVKNDKMFFMVYESNSDLETVYGSTKLALPAGVNETLSYLYHGRKCSFDVTFAAGSQTVEWDGTVVRSGSVADAVDTGDTLHLFSSSQWRHRSAARCYGLQIWQDGNLVRDFKPCLVDGKGMLYDMVTETIYRPSPDIPAERTGKVVFPEDATKPVNYVDYVESDGTVFVDTGVIGKSGTAADLKMQFRQKADVGFLESRKGDVRYYLWHNNTKSDTALYGYDGYYTALSGAAINTDYTVRSSLSVGSQTVTVNGSQTVSASSASNIDTGYDLYVFTCNKDGTPQYNGAARLYWLKLYQGDSDGSNMQLVRDFKPVRLSNGLVVLWDFVEDKPYLPKGVTEPYARTEFPVVGPDGQPILSPFVMVVR